jgi:hypothetical protein
MSYDTKRKAISLRLCSSLEAVASAGIMVNFCNSMGCHILEDSILSGCLLPNDFSLWQGFCSFKLHIFLIQIEDFWGLHMIAKPFDEKLPSIKKNVKFLCCLQFQIMIMLFRNWMFFVECVIYYIHIVNTD